VADPQLLRLILTNLLSNAVKYSPEGSTVRLCVQPTDDVVHITVSDEGIGIPSEDIDRLFEPFHRAENVGATRGTGLGLAILNEAVGVHNGDVKVESAKGKGSTFHVTLPRAHPVADAASRR
jgi:signal transduction histidine kinase